MICPGLTILLVFSRMMDRSYRIGILLGFSRIGSVVQGFGRWFSVDSGSWFFKGLAGFSKDVDGRFLRIWISVS